MDIEIRQARPEEYAELGDITARAYLGDGLLGFGADDPYLEELRDVAKRAAAARVLVATADGEVLGSVTFAAAGNPMAEVAGPTEAEIRMLAVAPRARRRGAGEALVRACLAHARDTDGCSAVVLSTQPTMHTAHRIYERLGFVRTPERDWNPLPDLVPGLKLLTYRLAL